MHSHRSRLISRALGCAFLPFLIGFALSETASAATIFGTAAEPEFLGDLTNYELGTYFESSVAGEITALRVYVGPVEAGNPGTIVGNLWDANGNILASATFSNIVAGWNEVALATPISIAPNTVYVVSGNTNAGTTATGAYAAQPGFFSGGSFSNPPLTALSGAFSFSPGAFPTLMHAANSYFRDVEFFPVLSVQIEVQPFIPKDPIILNSPLPLPVEVFGSSTVDVTKIDATTLRFGPKGIAPLFSQVVTVEGQQDLIAFFEVQDAGFAVGETQACLQGKIDGQPFMGCDDVIIIMRGCGLGFELAPILPALLWLRGRRRRKSE